MRLVHASAAAPPAGARPAKERAAEGTRVRIPPAARLRGLLAASESLLTLRDGDGRGERPDEAPGALGALLACERARAAGRPDRLLELVEDDLARGLAGAAADGPSDGPDADAEARPARPAARLAPGYCAALGLDGALPGQARARLAGLAALRGVLLAGQPCAALLPCLALELQALPRAAAAARGAPGAGEDAGTAGYLLGVLRRLGGSAGLGPAQARRAGDVAAWLAAAAGRSDAAAPAGEWWDEEAGVAIENVGGGVTSGGPPASRLGAFFAELAAGDAALAEPGDVARHHAAPAAPAGVAAGAPAACIGSDREGHGGSAQVPVVLSGYDPVAPDEGQGSAGSAAPDAEASAWAAAALRACAVRAAMAAAEAAAPAGELGRAGGGAARLFRRAGVGSEGRGASDLALAEWLCCGEVSQGSEAPDPAWASRKRRRTGPAEGAAAPGPTAAGGVLGDAELHSAGAPGLAVVKADGEARGPPGAAVKVEDGAPRPASPAPEPWGPAAAAARHGLPAPALLAPALARLLDARAWPHIAALERAGALQAQPAAQPGPDPDARPRAADGGAAGLAGGRARAEGAAEAAGLSDAEARAAGGGGAADAPGGGGTGELRPASAGGAAANERAESLESRRLLAAAGALAAFLRGVPAGAPGDQRGPGAAQAAAEGQRAVEALFVCLGAAPLPAPPAAPPAAPGLPAGGLAGPGSAAGSAAAPDRAPDAPAGLALPPGPLVPAGGGGAPAEPPPGPVAADPGTGLDAPAAGSALCELVGRLTRAEDAAAVAAAAAGALAWAGAFDSAPSRLAAAPGLAPRLQPGLAAVQACPAASAAGLAVRAGIRPAWA